MSETFHFYNDNLNAHYALDAVPNPDRYKLHTHPDFELYIFLGGRGTYYIEGTAYPLRRGDILVIGSGEAHYVDISPDVPYERCAVHFKEEFIRRIDPQGSLLDPFKERPLGRFNLFRKKDFPSGTHLLLVENMLADSHHREVQFITNFLALLSEIRTAFLSRDTQPDDDSQIGEILRYINANLGQELTLGTISDTFFISEAQLCRLFKKHTGSTVGHYITTKRMSAANELMREGHPITKVYAELGYADYSAFYKAYRKIFGFSPTKAKENPPGSEAYIPTT